MQTPRIWKDVQARGEPWVALRPVFQTRVCSPHSSPPLQLSRPRGRGGEQQVTSSARLAGTYPRLASGLETVSAVLEMRRGPWRSRRAWGLPVEGETGPAPAGCRCAGDSHWSPREAASHAAAGILVGSRLCWNLLSVLHPLWAWERRGVTSGDSATPRPLGPLAPRSAPDRRLAGCGEEKLGCLPQPQQAPEAVPSGSGPLPAQDSQASGACSLRCQAPGLCPRCRSQGASPPLVGPLSSAHSSAPPGASPGLCMLSCWDLDSLQPSRIPPTGGSHPASRSLSSFQFPALPNGEEIATMLCL